MTRTETAEEIVIRRVKGNEIGQVIELIAEAFQREISITSLDVQRLWGMARFYRILSYFYFILDLLRIDFETVLVAVLDGRVVGEIHPVPHGRRIWSLDSAAVDARFRGRGIFRKLMKEAEKYISERQGEKIITSLWTNNTASVKVTNELKFEVFEEKVLLCLQHINTQYLETKSNARIRTTKRTDRRKIYEIRKGLYQKRIEVLKNVQESCSEPIMQRIRNKVTRTKSEKWIMESEGKTMGYAKVTYTSKKEAANIESFYVSSSKAFLENIDLLLSEILIFLKHQGIEKVTASLDIERKEVIKRFQVFGFESIASLYEMVKILTPTNKSIEN